MPAFSINIHVLTQTEPIQQFWLDLQDRSECSYFQSWGWMSSWLDKVVDDRQVMVLQIWSDQLLVGLGLFVPADIKRHLVIQSKALFLNEYPFNGKNMVIEYNGILAARGYESAVYEAAVNYLINETENYDEYNFSGIPEDIASTYLTDSIGSSLKYGILEASESWLLELSENQESVDQYLSSLSRNRRGQIKRSIRLYEEQGSIVLQSAETLEEAKEYFKELEIFHTKRWQEKGKPGVFANLVWKNFHLDLISNRFNEGEVQMLKVTCAEKAIGYLYNFVWRKKVYVLQTGFNRPHDSRLMPGYVTHVLSIVHNYKLGMAEYDFLHGDDLYKKILSNKQHKLLWVVLQKQRIRFRFEDLVLRYVRACKRL